MEKTNLPIVGDDAFRKFVMELDTLDDDEKREKYIEEGLDELKSDNPILMRFIEIISQTTNDPSGAASCCLMTYKLLAFSAG